MPQNTDLVTDLPADFEVFGQAVATSMADLLGGTTGQILSKTSATDMDFTWIANDQGDLTAITAGTGISVTSGTGPIPSVAIDTAVTVDKTTAQTLTNKTLTSPALTTPTISTLTTNGDLVYGTGSGALSRLGIGSTSQVLTVAGGVPSWSTPAASASGLTLINATTFTAQTSVSINNCFSATYENYRIVLNYIGTASNWLRFRMRNSGTDDSTSNYRYAMNYLSATGTVGNLDSGNPDSFGLLGDLVGTGSQYAGSSCDIYSPFSSTRITSLAGVGIYSTAGMNFFATHNVASSFDGLTIYGSGVATITGNIRIYGYQNS